jgi:DNA-binding NtrC family response regulator
MTYYMYLKKNRYPDEVMELVRMVNKCKILAKQQLLQEETNTKKKNKKEQAKNKNHDL